MVCGTKRGHPYTRETFSADLKAGVTLVASYVPTTMALGVISGMGPLAGLWCGVFVRGRRGRVRRHARDGEPAPAPSSRSSPRRCSWAMI